MGSSRWPGMCPGYRLNVMSTVFPSPWPEHFQPRAWLNPG
ncbi:hypothetical protein C4K39_5983 [Pseudomonas sessilinigenes]|nr:hypothetical protein C4K39_5983 [Pseudomonas sessilinigenes]